MIEETSNATLQFIAGIFGGIVAIIVAFIKTTNKRDEKTRESLRKEMEDLEILFLEEKKVKDKIQNKYNSIKMTFRVVFKEYELKFKDKPELMGMLKDLRDAFEN